MFSRKFLSDGLAVFNRALIHQRFLGHRPSVYHHILVVIGGILRYANQVVLHYFSKFIGHSQAYETVGNHYQGKTLYLRGIFKQVTKPRLREDNIMKISNQVQGFSALEIGTFLNNRRNCNQHINRYRRNRETHYRKK